METSGASQRVDRELPAVVPAWQVWLETLVLTAMVPIVGIFADPRDPFFVRSSFPWSALAPILVGLRHGAIPGVSSGTLLVMGIGFAWRNQWLPMSGFPAQFAMAVLVMGLVAGEFSDLWSRRNRRLATMVDYHRQRLEEFTRTYQVLKASHDILQQNVAADAQSLRDALISVRRQITDVRRPSEPFGGAADTILSLFAEFGQIQVAALFAVDERGAVATDASARLGQGDGAMDGADPMIAFALQQKEIVSIGVEFRGAEATTKLLAAVPLVDVNGRVWGVVAVEEMLFTAFQNDTLRLLAVLGGHLGDLLAFRSDSPDRAQFTREVQRAVADAKQHGVPSSLVRITARDDARTKALFDRIVEKRRGLDRAIAVENGLSRSLFVLLPLTDQAGLDKYTQRVKAAIQSQLGITAGDAGVDITGKVLHSEDASDDLVKPLATSVAA